MNGYVKFTRNSYSINSERYFPKTQEIELLNLRHSSRQVRRAIRQNWKTINRNQKVERSIGYIARFARSGFAINQRRSIKDIQPRSKQTKVSGRMRMPLKDTKQNQRTVHAQRDNFLRVLNLSLKTECPTRQQQHPFISDSIHFL